MNGLSAALEAASVKTVISSPRPALMHVRSHTLTVARFRALWVALVFAAVLLVAAIALQERRQAGVARQS